MSAAQELRNVWYCTNACTGVLPLMHAPCRSPCHHRPRPDNAHHPVSATEPLPTSSSLTVLRHTQPQQLHRHNYKHQAGSLRPLLTSQASLVQAQGRRGLLISLESLVQAKGM